MYIFASEWCLNNLLVTHILDNNRCTKRVDQLVAVVFPGEKNFSLYYEKYI